MPKLFKSLNCFNCKSLQLTRLLLVITTAIHTTKKLFPITFQQIQLIRPSAPSRTQRPLQRVRFNDSFNSIIFLPAFTTKWPFSIISTEQGEGVGNQHEWMEAIYRKSIPVTHRCSQKGGGMANLIRSFLWTILMAIDKAINISGKWYQPPASTQMSRSFTFTQK